MKENKIQIIGCFIIITIFIIMMFYTIGSKLYFHFNKGEVTESLESVKWDELYPYDETYLATDLNKNLNKVNIFEKYEKSIEKIKNKLENYSSIDLFGYEKFIECSYIYNDIISYELVDNSSGTTRIKIEDEYLSRLVKKENTEEASNRLIEFNKYLKELNIDMLYIQAPYKISETQKISSIYKDYSNENMNNFLKNIDEKVQYIDLRKNISKSNIDQLKLFYKTDHHWLPETGLWATNEISEYLNDNYNLNMEIDNIRPENFNVKTYSKMFFGTDGRYVSLKNAKPEDFDLIIPKFNTKLNVKILDKGVNKTDTYENTLIDWDNIKYVDYYKSNQYSSYIYGNRPLIEIHNEMVHNDKKILLVRDSFSEVVAPFLALENEYLSVIDLRHFNGSLKNYINQFKPDMVIVMYNGNVLIDLNNTEQYNNERLLPNMWNFE